LLLEQSMTASSNAPSPCCESLEILSFPGFPSNIKCRSREEADVCEFDVLVKIWVGSTKACTWSKSSSRLSLRPNFDSVWSRRFERSASSSYWVWVTRGGGGSEVIRWLSRGRQFPCIKAYGHMVLHMG